MRFERRRLVLAFILITFVALAALAGIVTILAHPNIVYSTYQLPDDALVSGVFKTDRLEILSIGLQGSYSTNDSIIITIQSNNSFKVILQAEDASVIGNWTFTAGNGTIDYSFKDWEEKSRCAWCNTDNVSPMLLEHLFFVLTIYGQPEDSLTVAAYLKHPAWQVCDTTYCTVNSLANAIQTLLYITVVVLGVIGIAFVALRMPTIQVNDE